MPDKRVRFVWLGKVLHTHFDKIVSEPLPKRFVELIEELKEQEPNRLHPRIAGGGG